MTRTVLVTEMTELANDSKPSESGKRAKAIVFAVYVNSWAQQYAAF